jgi:predicted nucleotide-binding protein/nucleoside 2-deoxyribosyltransferase
MVKTCFLISPLGAENSEVRKYAEDFWEFIVFPACEEMNYQPIRVDKIHSARSITRDILELLFKSDVVIADLSYLNPNVMYELGVRHSTGKPVILMAKKGQTIPFDVATIRTIIYDLYDTKSIINTRKLLIETLKHIENTNEIDSPVIDARRTSNLDKFEKDKSNYKPENENEFKSFEIESSLKTIIDRIGNLENSVRVIGKEMASKTSTEYSRDIFIVHGHDGELKNELARFLEKLNFNPIILHEQPDKGLTIIQKLQFESSKVGYSFILYTPDDEGKKRNDKSDLQLRSRQNVIFEHGLFVGKFNPERVCAIVKENVEIPSDLSGVVYKKIPKNGSIMTIAIEIISELKAAGYKIDANKIFKEI